MGAPHPPANTEQSPSPGADMGRRPLPDARGTDLRDAMPQSSRGMKARVAEVLHQAVWALFLGIVSGTACVGVRLGFRLLQELLIRRDGLLPDAAASLSPVHRVATPILGAVLATLVLLAARRWSRAAPFEEYTEAVRSEHGQIPLGSTVWRTLSSAFSVASGAAVGREGSMIQFAAATISWLGARLPASSVSLASGVAFGVAAAVAAVYQAPVAGIFFAFEIVLCAWTWAELPGLAVASTAGWAVSSLLLSPGPLFPVHGTLPRAGILWTVPLALALGALGPVYQALLRSLSFLKTFPVPLVWGGLAVGALSLKYTAVWGNGDVGLTTVLSGAIAPVALGMLLGARLLASTACVGTGTVGGVFTPTVFAGAALGLLGARLVHAPTPVLLAVAGLSTLLAAATHAPWMAGFMAVELTGQWHLLPWLLVLNLLAAAIAQRLSPRSLYAIASPVPTKPAGQPTPDRKQTRSP